MPETNSLMLLNRLRQNDDLSGLCWVIFVYVSGEARRGEYIFTTKSTRKHLSGHLCDALSHCVFGGGLGCFWAGLEQAAGLLVGVFGRMRLILRMTSCLPIVQGQVFPQVRLFSEFL